MSHSGRQNTLENVRKTHLTATEDNHPKILWQRKILMDLPHSSFQKLHQITIFGHNQKSQRSCIGITGAFNSNGSPASGNGFEPKRVGFTPSLQLADLIMKVLAPHLDHNPVNASIGAQCASGLKLSVSKANQCPPPVWSHLRQIS